MPTLLGDRLALARRRRFVGRAAELELFRRVLLGPDDDTAVLYVFGPGGIGKTSLLDQFVASSRDASVAASYLDGRNVEPSPDGFFDALRRALDAEPDVEPLEALAARGGRHVILVDTYENLAPLDPWLREVFLPSLPDRVLVVLAGRLPPRPAWRSDPGWQSVVRALPLRNLDPEESRSYLANRAIPADQHDAVLVFTHGHPLALSLVADTYAQRPGFVFEPQAAPDVVRTLLEQLVQKVPGPAHRTALEACVLVRLTTEPLLAHMLGMTDAGDLFDWLRTLSFIEAGPLGIFPHDLARDALIADLRWRNPDWYAELHRRARGYYTSRIMQSQGFEQQRLLFDDVFLHRDNPLVRPFFEWQEHGTTVVTALQPDDVPALVGMTEAHEGEESARLLRHWLGRQPQGVFVYRDAQRQPIGFLAIVAMEQATADDLDADPAVREGWRHVQRHAPLRPGERALYFRFWMAKETYQAVSAVQSSIFITAVRHYLVTPGLAYHLFACADPEFWRTPFSYADLHRVPEVDFSVGDRRYGVYAHDWRVRPPVAWLTLLGEREIARAVEAPEPARTSEPLIVLSRPDFEGAVHAALRDFARPDALRSNPLLKSRLIVEACGAKAGAGDRVAALRAMLKEAADSLKLAPSDHKLYRALYRTYLHPAGTQEQAAEVLDLPFSTYRRHLKAGILRVVEILWLREVQGPERP